MNIIHLMKQADSLSPNMRALLKQTRRTPDNKDNSGQYSKEALKQRLTDLEYSVTQEKHTESPFSGRYVHESTPGTYCCLVCGAELFDSRTKFDSNSGWPSFNDVINRDSILFLSDISHGQYRVEILCNHCKSHLGHVFDDGPKPTGLRYCVNSCALTLNPSSKQ